jgi:hypothetical protein
MNRNIGELMSSWLLGLFAAISLPFSLTYSLLSRQKHLADLKFPLYDFCGVIAFFGSLALAMNFVIKQYAKRKSDVHDTIRLIEGFKQEAHVKKAHLVWTCKQ